MAICLVLQGFTQQQYEQVLNEVSPGNQAPPGMLYHIACAEQPGGFKVIEVWESQEQMDRFFQEKAGAALQRASINIQPEVLPVHNLMRA